MQNVAKEISRLPFQMVRQGYVINFVALGGRLTLSPRRLIGLVETPPRQEAPWIRRSIEIQELRAVFPDGVALAELMVERQVPSVPVVIPDDDGSHVLELSVGKLLLLIEENTRHSVFPESPKVIENLESVFREALIRLIGGQQD